MIIGAGIGGSALVETLNEGSYTEVVGIADPNIMAIGLRKAELLTIPTFLDYREMLNTIDYDVIVDVTGSKAVAKEIAKYKSDDVEVIGGSGAHLMWELIDERRRGREETKRRLERYEDLYRLGLVLSSSQDMREVHYVVIDYATRLTNCPAGSLVMFDEKTDEMVLGAAKGFSPDFFKVRRWKLRRGGLNSYVLNQNKPVVIADIAKFKSFDDQTLANERIKSIAASPLTVEGKTIGILYVDDFVQRLFTDDDVGTLSLISTYAALSIEHTKLLEDTRMMAITDGLTGLYNHRYLFTRLEEELERAKRYKHPLTLITFDIDYFKNYNDSQGHLHGNEALRKLGGIIRENTRQIDLAARCGGEEFAVIMPETTKAKGLEFAERLRQNIEKASFYGEEEQPGRKLTVSMGVASLPEDSDDGSNVMDKADQALYEAKRRGRNQVVAYEDGMAPIGISCQWRTGDLIKKNA